MSSLSREDRNLLLCWLYDGIYKFLPRWKEPDVTKLLQDAARLPRVTGMKNFSKATISDIVAEHVEYRSWKCLPVPMKTTSIILVDWGKQNKPLAPAPGPATQTNPPAAAPPPPPKTAAAPPQSTAKAPAPQPTAKAPAPQPTVKAQAPQPTAKAPPPPPPKPAAAPLQPTAKAPAPQPTAKAPAPQPTAKAPAPQSTAKAPAPQPTAKTQAPQPTAKAPPPPPPKPAAAPLQPTAKAPAAPQPIQAPAPGPSTPSSLQPPPAGVNVQETAPAIPNHSKRQDDPTPSNNDPNQGPVQGDATNTATSSVALGEGAYPTPKGTPAIPESPMKEAVQHWWDAPRSDLEDPSTDDSRSRLEELVSNADSLFVNRKSKASIRNALEYIPLFTSDLLRSASDVALPPQFAVFGKFLGPESADSSEQRLLLLNTNTPWTTFICGLQGSGKSHSLTAMLESCLIRDESIGCLQKPLSGLVFHYSRYHSNVESEPCEAAHLANMRDNSKNSLAPQVTVLVSPSNIGNMRTAYANIPNVTIREFQLNPSQLNIDTMFDLMSVRENSGLLYMDIVRRVLRDMAIENNATNKPFDYDKFKKLLFQGELVGMQSGPLKQRLTILESFIGPKDSPNLFHATPGTLTIVDLTCRFVDSETACVLFGICNQLFTSAPKLSGKIIALDEAHRYMTDNASASVKRFAESIIGNIRLERHLGLRTIVSTQDPFIHPEIMELSSMVIFHRFDIPRWFEEIRKHVGFQTKTQAPEPSQNVWGDEELQKPGADIFEEIKSLDTGEACIYCPKLVIPENSWGVSTLKKFGNGVFKVMIRQKITIDGGASKNVL